jgi:hypothetical protein
MLVKLEMLHVGLTSAIMGLCTLLTQGYHTLTLPEPAIRIPLLSGFKRIATSPALNENILSDKILSLLSPNFSIFAGLIRVPMDKRYE